ncbi:uncharacterized protein L969DRAFT_85941 [Mixia osmundae IAM 14324]|nr:uncharacterized protein L969DRAFT_85941 [Mixia osmundae IAM 14324]KEI40721.1 hypothetical protein L969DRAFT_85941 [Mixia osmundae IAM 14324]
MSKLAKTANTAQMQKAWHSGDAPSSIWQDGRARHRRGSNTSTASSNASEPVILDLNHLYALYEAKFSYIRPETWHKARVAIESQCMPVAAYSNIRATPSQESILGAYASQGNGDQELLLALLLTKCIFDQYHRQSMKRQAAIGRASKSSSPSSPEDNASLALPPLQCNKAASGKRARITLPGIASLSSLSPPTSPEMLQRDSEPVSRSFAYQPPLPRLTGGPSHRDDMRPHKLEKRRRVMSVPEEHQSDASRHVKQLLRTKLLQRSPQAALAARRVSPSRSRSPMPSSRPLLEKPKLDPNHPSLYNAHSLAIASRATTCRNLSDVRSSV